MVGTGKWEVGFRIQHSLGVSWWGGVLYGLRLGGGGEVLVPWSEAFQILLQIKSKGCARVLDSGANLSVGFLWQTEF